MDQLELSSQVKEKVEKFQPNYTMTFPAQEAKLLQGNFWW